MPNLSMTFDQYNRDQERLTKWYQKKLAKNRAIVFTGGRINVKKNEVQEEIKKLGVNVHWDTILNWEKAGLLPKSKMVGREKDFPNDYHREVYATCNLKNSNMRLTYKIIKAAREMALQMETEKLFSKALDEGFLGEHAIALKWQQDKIKANPESTKYYEKWMLSTEEGKKHKKNIELLREIGRKNTPK